MFFRRFVCLCALIGLLLYNEVFFSALMLVIRGVIAECSGVDFVLRVWSLPTHMGSVHVKPSHAQGFM